ncbi:MAG: hypothetical protein MUF15_22880 [Acidobacteria bacterium]|jgi:cell division protein FtsW (lipid II flippase)|nr:hypothetical protein [Acidobacteriota bacterium]
MRQDNFSLKVDLPVLGLFALALLTGVILYYVDLPTFSTYIEEDGIVEWLTAASLAACATVCLIRYFRLRSQKKRIFSIVLLVMALVFIFGMGEELSWGQRIFNYSSNNFFTEHNTQQEVNVHNLQFGKVRLNKIIFSLLLSILFCFYLFVLPILYRLLKKIKQWVDDLAVPVPRNYQLIAYGALFIAIGVIHDSRKWELLEMGSTMLFLVILNNPLNKEIFQKVKAEEIKQIVNSE